MTQTLHTTLLIIGGGPGGYVAAIRAGQLGIPTILVEGQALGGTCLNIGCIPSKALIHVAEQFQQTVHHSQGSQLGIEVDVPTLDIRKSVAWKDAIVDRLTSGVAALLKKHKVQVIHGWAKVVDGKTVDVDGQRIQCEHLLLATGSKSVNLPMLPIGGPIISSTEALAPTRVPKRLIVVGGGYIGLELGIAYRKLGAEVSVVEAQERILPAYDAELTQPVAESLKQLGVKLYLKHSVTGFEHNRLQVRDPKGDTVSLETDQVLVAVGRTPNTRGWNLEALDLEMHGAAVRIDHRCQTSMRNVWAIGDLSGEPMLAHRAMAQGEMVAELISGQHREFNPAAIPAVCFTDPELVVVGKSPDEAKAAGLDCIVSSFPFAANGRAMTLESKSGFVRVVARRDNHLIVGWQAVGVGVSELSTAFGLSLEMGARLEDVAGTIHAHPTLGEAVQEAALRALGHPLHL
ncbi:dihydrolipoyl dehydrogenase [Pseudomonas veronii]|jgi:dihydrolipoamide dehydrogenase|uniref:dihydrolipoyl dehydrogenase n=1 Tax=Pseudomonas TaxID=286 RepID=UPI000CF31BE2|nr:MULTISPECIES: dihydrolipoyl dehydrogenase [Pseudomonas]MCT8963194.1 dihydrolipoyl dehydrogenase [Pseudomonas veronii]MCT9823925.1 dihydrolipoyl dehydrogenase [Pseudomonas veronii]NMX53731.1 dihydrolipoyl dehydrogenase [Pseudomonas veronii]RTY72800.1 dihydrolipoyl dehydrogenase [Pseudomonas veronii]UHG96051.1 dihydrolipoyl dehydrogenase [Pseudomonas sp. 7-41]